MNALLIATRGQTIAQICDKTPTGHPFGPNIVRIPGAWGGSCANCKWRDWGQACSCYDPDELLWVPRGRVESPAATRVEEMVDDSDEELNISDELPPSEESEDNDDDDDDDDDDDNQPGPVTRGGPPRPPKGPPPPPPGGAIPPIRVVV